MVFNIIIMLLNEVKLKLIRIQLIYLKLQRQTEHQLRFNNLYKFSGFNYV